MQGAIKAKNYYPNMPVVIVNKWKRYLVKNTILKIGWALYFITRFKYKLPSIIYKSYIHIYKQNKIKFNISRFCFVLNNFT